MKPILLASCVALLPTLAAAEPSRLFCQLDVGSRGVIGDKLFVEVDQPGKNAMVADPFILHFKRKPIAAEIGEASDSKLTVMWDLVLVNSNGQQTRMAYRAAVLKKTNQVLVTAKPHGYSNTFTARGRCAPTTAPLPGS